MAQPRRDEVTIEVGGEVMYFQPTWRNDYVQVMRPGGSRFELIWADRAHAEDVLAMWSGGGMG